MDLARRMPALLASASLVAIASAQQSSFVVDGRLDGEQHGAALCRLEDVDGDGGDDLAIGAPLGGPQAQRSGSVRIVRGRDGATLVRMKGRQGRDRFGATLDLTLDLDGDGVGDLLVGAPQRLPADSWSAVYTPGGGVGPGYVELRSSRSGSLLRAHAPAQDSEGFGSALASGADVDGDGQLDYLVGAPAPRAQAGEPGDVWLFSGASGQLLRHHVGDATIGEVGFGAALCFVPDVDGDGVWDYAVGAPGGAGYLAGPGRVTLFSGATGAMLWTRALGGNAGLGLGRGLSTGGDADGDGHVDLVAWSCGILNEGYASWLSATDGKLLKYDYGYSIDCQKGAAPTALWDLGLGSRPAVAFNSCTGIFVEVWSDRGYGALVTLTPASLPLPEEGFGLALAGGDFDADGQLDLAVGAPHAVTGTAATGRVTVFLGVYP